MKNFYVISNSEKDTDYAIADRITQYVISKNASCITQRMDYNCADANLIPKDTECVIVLGGDGTLIQAARALSETGVLLFGINIGTLGYLMEVDLEQAYPSIDKLIADDYITENRMILQGEVYRNGKIIYSDRAVNDIVLNRLGSLRIINFEIYVNDEYLITYPADGLIIATPTGSTAYNLSAGGPIVRPQTESIVMTPVCPHVLNKSSVIFGGEDILEIRLNAPKTKVEERVVTFDGSEYINLITGDRIVIKKSSLSAKIARIEKHNFLQVLRSKLS